MTNYKPTAQSTSLAVACLLLLLSAFAKAELKNFAFSGTVTSVVNRRFQLDDSIVVGTPFQGFYVFDTTAAVDSNSDPTVGDYRFSAAKFGVVVKVGNYVFRTNPRHVNFLMEVVNRSTGDNYLLRSYNNVCSRPVAVEHIAWQLDDASGHALADDVLPVTPPTLSRWQSLFGLSVSGISSSFIIGGEVTSIAETSAVIPATPAVSLGFAVEVKWQSRMGYYYQIQRSSDMAAWADVGEPVLGDGTQLSRFFPDSPSNRVFYRAVIAAFQN